MVSQAVLEFDQPGHVRRDCTAGSKADAGTFMVSAVVNTNMAEEYHRPVRQQAGSIPAGLKEQHMWLVDNGSEIHLSTVAADFHGRDLLLPAGYPVSIQTATGRADIAGYAQLELAVVGVPGRPVFLDVMFAYVPMARPCRLISMPCSKRRIWEYRLGTKFGL